MAIGVSWVAERAPVAAVQSGTIVSVSNEWNHSCNRLRCIVPLHSLPKPPVAPPCCGLGLDYLLLGWNNGLAL